MSLVKIKTAEHWGILTYGVKKIEKKKLMETIGFDKRGGAICVHFSEAYVLSLDRLVHTGCITYKQFGTPKKVLSGHASAGSMDD